MLSIATSRHSFPRPHPFPPFPPHTLYPLGWVGAFGCVQSSIPCLLLAQQQEAAVQEAFLHLQLLFLAVARRERAANGRNPLRRSPKISEPPEPTRTSNIRKAFSRNQTEQVDDDDVPSGFLNGTKHQLVKPPKKNSLGFLKH